MTLFRVEGNLDLVEDSVNELFAQVAQFRERHPYYPADFTAINLCLHDFKQKYMAKHTLRYNYYAKKSFRNMHSNIAKVEMDPLPILFMNDQPVLKLSMYNIHCSTSKAELTDLLKVKNLKDFHIADFIAKKSGGTAIVICQTFASACKLQCMACTFDLSYVSNANVNSSIKYMRVRPLMEIKRRKTVHLPPITFLDIIEEQTPILRGIAKYLEPIDLYNFYLAANQSRNFGGIKFEFIFDKDIYNTFDKIKEIVREAGIFKFTSLNFDCEEDIILPPLLVDILKNCIRSHGVAESEKVQMDYANFKGISVTDEIMKLLHKKINVNALILGKFALTTELNIACNKLYELAVANNDRLRLKVLVHENLSNLVFLTLENCSKLRMRFLCDFVKNNRILQQLIIEDCTQIDIDCRIGEIIECVWSGRCCIEIFHYTFTEKNKSRTLSYPFESELGQNLHIRRVKFNNNTYISSYLPSVLRNSPYLRSLEILNIGKELILDFGPTPHLVTLAIDYNKSFNTTLCTLEEHPLKVILAKNSKRKSKTAPLNIDPIFEIIHNNDDFIFKLIGHVKLCDPEQLDIIRLSCTVIRKKQYLVIDYREGHTEYYNRSPSESG